MPRYYFQVIDAAELYDDEGIELSDEVEAREVCLRTAGDILSDERDTYWKDGKWEMSVADAAGNICLTLSISAHKRDGCA